MTLSGRYQLHERIGEGGMALVYRATDLRLNRQVAVKMLRPQYAADPEFVERFAHEAHAAAALSHPNMAAVYDTGQDGEVHYIVMELLRNFTLRDLIAHQPNQRLTAADTVRYGCDIASAIAHAHQRGVVHRDIKPQNMLFTDDGLVKVTDFGIARALAATGGTATGTILGSPHYISPEQASGQTAGPASDIYSIGVVLYEMVTGRTPYTGETPIAIAVQHLRSRPQPPSELVPDLPPALEGVILRAMARQPQDRFRSADELRLALEASLSGGVDPTRTMVMPAGAMAAVPGEPATAQREGYPRGVAPRRISPAAIVLLIALVVFGVAAGIIYSGRDAAPPEPPKSSLPKPEITGPKQITAPDLKGQDIEKARQFVETDYRNMQLVPPQVVEAGRRDDKQPKGTIIDQEPKAGTPIKEGDVIRVIVSTGKVSAKVPVLVGVPLDEAKEKLKQAKLVLGDVQDAESETYQPDIVMKTNPPAGTAVPEGSPVNLTVSAGLPGGQPGEPDPGKPDAGSPDEPPKDTPKKGSGAKSGTTSDVSVHTGEPRDLPDGAREANIEVAVPAKGRKHRIELRWLQGAEGTAYQGQADAGQIIRRKVKGAPGAVLGVFVDDVQRTQVQY